MNTLAIEITCTIQHLLNAPFLFLTKSTQTIHQVCLDILDILQAHRNPHQTIANPGSSTCFWRHPAVRRSCRMRNRALGVAKISRDRDHSRTVDQFPGGFLSVLEVERDDAATGFLLPHGQGVLRMGRQAGIIDPCNATIQTKKAQDKKTTSEKIFTGILLFVITFTFGWFILVPQMDSYKVAKEYLLTDKYISNEIGEVSSIVLLPAGSISTSSRSAGTTGQAELNFIVKGKLKFKDINVQLYKKVNSDWTIYKP